MAVPAFRSYSVRDAAALPPPFPFFFPLPFLSLPPFFGFESADAYSS